MEPNTELLNIFFLGRSGCGKGTQAEFLTKYLEQKFGASSVLYMYAGAKFRELVKREDNYTARLVNEKVLKIGDKAPDFLATWTWGSRFVEEMDDKRHLILDGSPRTPMEAMLLDGAMEFYDRSRVYPILLDVTEEEVIRRMKLRGRNDDRDEQIKNRMNYYHKYVVPAIEYYRTQSPHKIVVVDGNTTDRELIHKNILKALGI